MSTTRQPLAKLEMGTHDQFWRKLHSKGVCAEDIEHAQGDEGLINEVAATLVMRHLLTPASEQREKLLYFNETVWKDRSVNPHAITDAGEPPRDLALRLDSISAPVLLRETGDPVRTMRENWKALASVHGDGGVELCDGIVLDAKHIRVRPGAIKRRQGIRWAVVELGGFWGFVSFETVKERLQDRGLMAVGQELPLIAAMHPLWAWAKRGGGLLQPLIALDIELAPFGSGSTDSSVRVPRLCVDQSFDVVRLYSARTDVRHCDSCIGWFLQ